MRWNYRFESSVNSEGIETGITLQPPTVWFESSVNSEGIETSSLLCPMLSSFESSVNSEGIETSCAGATERKGLRAV